MFTDFFITNFLLYLPDILPKILGESDIIRVRISGGIGYHISIFLIFIELAKISSFVQQSTRLKGTFCKKMQQASTSIGAKEMYTS